MKKIYQQNTSTMERKVKQVGITGGTTAGKSAILPFIIEEMPRYGVKPFIVDEVATTLFSGGVQLNETSNTQELIVNKMIHDEDIMRSAAEHYTGNLMPVIFCDRGILDCKVYCKPGEFEQILLDLNTTEHLLKDRYDGVIHLETTAKGAEDVFRRVFKDNPVRIEGSIEEAREKDTATQHAWLGTPKFSVVKNSGSFEDKKRQFLKEVLRILGIPVPQEIEYKYLVPRSFSTKLIPVPYETVELTQYYLKETSMATMMAYPRDAYKIVERIRCREAHGSRTFIYTLKAFVKGEEDPYELEDFITEREFAQLKKYTYCNPIRKQRTYFIWNDQYFEFDQFETSIDSDNSGLLELEVAERYEITLPDFIPNLLDVTKNDFYKNESIALRLTKN